MTFSEIVSFVCAKVQKQDSNSQAVCLTFVQKRHRQIYEAYNWHAAQVIINKSTIGGQLVTQMDVPEAAHCLSVAVDNEMLQHATTSYIYETMHNGGFNTAAAPYAYDEFYSPTDQHPIIRFWPALVAKSDGTAYAVSILGKAPLPADVSVTATIIPHTGEALIAFALADMWEYMNQLGKAQSKYQEANALLIAAMAADTPANEPRIIPSIDGVGGGVYAGWGVAHEGAEGWW